ncbi:MAG: type II secretion system protein N [Maricaulaceae bacterium]
MSFVKTTLAAVLGGTIAAITYLPLAWVAPRLIPNSLAGPVSYMGTVWDGHVTDGLIVGQTMPPLSLKLSVWEMLRGDDFFHFKTDGIPALKGSAKIGQVNNVKLVLPLMFFSDFDGRLAGVNGDIDIQLESLKFSDRCEAASGEAKTDVLQRNMALWQWTGPALVGPITCENGSLVSRLSGKDRTQKIETSLTVSSDGSHKSEMFVTTTNAQMQLFLPYMGFEKRGNQYVLVETGRWQ